MFAASRSFSLVSIAALTVLGSGLSAQVEEWGAVKAQLWELTPLQPNPINPFEYEAAFWVRTASASDAASVVLSGGTLSAPVNLVYEDGEWAAEFVYSSKTALDAHIGNMLPFTLTLSGGSLGTLQQTLSFGPETYPNAPVLPSSAFYGTQSFHPSQALSLDFPASGYAGDPRLNTVIELESPSRGMIVDSFGPGESRSFNLDACTLGFSEWAWLYFSFVMGTTHSGAGGFGVDGTTYYESSLDFTVVTSGGTPAMTIPRAGFPANPSALTGNNSLPVIGQIWAPRISHQAFATGALFDFLAVDTRPSINIPTQFGTLLVQVPHTGQIFSTPAGVPFQIPIPPLCWLDGVPAVAQGASFTPGQGLELTNALDLTLGQ